MGLKEIFQKHGGMNLIKQYARVGVLGTAIGEFLLLGKSRTALEILRMAVQFKTKIKLKRKYMHVLDDFEKEYNEAYEYEYYHGDISEKDVTVLVAVIDSDSAEDVINDVAKKNSVEDENMYSVELNDLKWYIAGYQTRKSIVYYNAFDHNSGKVVLFRYEIQNTLEDDSSYVDIINSIFEKQVEVEDELVEEDENKPRKINNNSKNETNNNSSKNESNTNTNSSENETEEDEDEKENTSKNETNTNTKKSKSITINSVSNNTIEDDETEEDE